jgi:N-methylhydantoinase A
MPIAIGIDTGGTFTDFVVVDEAGVRLHKVLSTPDAPERAILEGLAELGFGPGPGAPSARIVHGSTVATNAALEGKGARTVYVADRGLGDVLTLGRQDRPSLYDLTPAPLPEPVPRELCVELDARLGADGSAVEPLTDAALTRLTERVTALAPDAVAINLVFSWRDDGHERRVEAALRAALGADTFVTRSSFVLPEYREYERGMATWLNASLGPHVEGYLERLAAALAPAPVAIMQSSGGTMDAAVASRRAVNLLLSGPAGGVAAASHLAREAGIDSLLTFDMGGTSTDVTLIRGAPALTNQARIGPWPVAVPMLDIHAIGAGGGSLARLDEGGALAVGPESAGADPGPVCYGRGGTVATVTDAHLVLGRLPATTALGGHLGLDRTAAVEALATLGDAMGTTGPDAAAIAAGGVVALADEHMAAALRVMSLDRGIDPRSATLCCFGGAGGLHLCGIAEHLEMREALVPAHAGVLSALGMLVARPERQLSRSIEAPLADLHARDLGTLFEHLEQDGMAELEAEGHEGSTLTATRSVALRYLGQAFSLELPWPAGPTSPKLAALAGEFEALHAERYGHRLDAVVELDALRVRLRAPSPPLPPRPDTSGNPADPQATVPVAGEDRPVPVHARGNLVTGQRLAGPAIIVEDTSTTWVGRHWTAERDAHGHLRLRR